MKRRTFGSTTLMQKPGAYTRPAHVKKFYEACNLTKKTKRNQAIIAMLAYTGRRISEVLQVRIYDIDFDQRKILFRTLKRKKEMTQWIPINKKLINILEEYIKSSKLKETDWLFPGRKFNKHLARSSVNKMITKLGEITNIRKIGGDNIHPHMFRHGLAMFLVSKGVDVRTMQELLGHSSLITTQWYLDHSGIKLKESVLKTEMILEV